MEFLKKRLHWLKPRRIDRYFIATALIFVAGLVASEVAIVFSELGKHASVRYGIGPLAVVTIILACSLAIQPLNQVGRQWWLGGCWVMSVIIAMIFVSRFPIGDHAGRLLQTVLLIFFPAFFYSKVLVVAQRAISSRWGPFTITRPKLMIAFVLFLFLMSIVARISTSDWFLYQQAWVWKFSSALQILAGLIFFILVVFIPCRIVHETRPLTGPWYLGCYLFAIGIPLAIILETNSLSLIHI